MIGQRLAHFHVTAKLGEGGMGAVYRATDSKLGREVAIKVLPEAVTEDPERLARFEREARVLASLNHPNIASIYEVGAHEGVHFIVMELAPGESLAERIERGGLELDDTLPMALKMATALEAAHEQGIMHRDLKPANIQVSDDGDIKILDFGLAKAFEEDSTPGAELSNSPTLSRHATQAGVLMGTAAYMSPEQARGKSADRRSDIWAFGVVLWEMLTGRRLFSGDTISDTLAAVLRQDIKFDVLPETSATVLRLLRRCLERDTTRRLQHIGDARLELEDALASNDPTLERTTLPWPKLAVAAGLLTLVTATVTYFATAKIDATIEPRRSLIQTEPLVTVFPPSISPDGRRGLYSTGDRLWLWELDRFEPRSWEGEFRSAYFSADSQHISYSRGTELWRMNLVTGERRVITAATFARGSVWSADGTITFLDWGSRELYRVPADGGDAIKIAGPFDVQRELTAALPNDRGLVFTNYTDGGIDILADGEWTSLHRGEDIEWVSFSPTGHLLYHRPDDGLWAQRFSLETLSTTAGPIQIDPIGAWPTFSSNGRLSYKRGLDQSQFVVMNREGRVTQRIGRPQFMLQDPSVSPNGNSVAGVSREQGQFAVWLHEIDSGQARRLTFDVKAGTTSATWSPDGRYLYFRTTGFEIAKLDVRGEEALRIVAEAAGFPHASTDGRYLVYASQSGDIFHLDLESDSPPQLFFEGAATERTPRFSIDGTVIAYISDESGRQELYVRRFPSGEGRRQVSTDGAGTPRWSTDGSELYYLQGRDLMAVPVSTGESFESGEPEKLFTLASPTFYEYSVTRDGQFVVVQPGEETSTIAIVDQWQSFFDAANE